MVDALKQVKSAEYDLQADGVFVNAGNVKVLIRKTQRRVIIECWRDGSVLDSLSISQIYNKE